VWPERPFGRVPFWAIDAHDSSAGYIKERLRRETQGRDALAVGRRGPEGVLRARHACLPYDYTGRINNYKTNNFAPFKACRQ